MLFSILFNEARGEKYKFGEAARFFEDPCSEGSIELLGCPMLLVSLQGINIRD